MYILSGMNSNAIGMRRQCAKHQSQPKRRRPCLAFLSSSFPYHLQWYVFTYLLKGINTVADLYVKGSSITVNLTVNLETLHDRDASTPFSKAQALNTFYCLGDSVVFLSAAAVGTIQPEGPNSSLCSWPRLKCKCPIIPISILGYRPQNISDFMHLHFLPDKALHRIP